YLRDRCRLTISVQRHSSSTLPRNALEVCDNVEPVNRAADSPALDRPPTAGAAVAPIPKSPPRLSQHTRGRRCRSGLRRRAVHRRASDGACRLDRGVRERHAWLFLLSELTRSSAPGTAP